MDIRNFVPADKEGCLALLDSNAPEYFSAAEREAFDAWLDAPQGSYFVMEHEGDVVGCGGFALESPQLASLTWLMIRSDLRGQGLGRFLVFYCLRALSGAAAVSHIRLHTISSVAGFFEKQGFRVQHVAPDGVEMVKKLQVCS